MKRSAKTGFTLVELLVVIAIISILAGMLLPVLEKAKAQGIQRMSQLRQSGLAWQRYTSDHNHAVALNVEGVPPERAWVPLDEREETFEGGWFGVTWNKKRGGPATRTRC